MLWNSPAANSLKWALCRVPVCCAGNAALLECYSFGVAQFIDVQNQLGHVDVVIINSNWCGYTKDAREHCGAAQVGLFTIAEFMGALGQEDFWNYQTPAEREREKAARRG